MKPKEQTSLEKLKMRSEKLGLGDVRGGHQKHIFLCTGDACAGAGVGEKSWEHLKSRLAERGLSPGAVYRTKVGCLRLCEGGPVGLVYPDGIWYRGLTPEALDLVIERHLGGGQPVQDLVVATHALPSPTQNSLSSSSCDSE